MLQITFPSTETFYQFTTAIEGATYTIQMQWMTRTEFWYMSIFNANSTLLASNIQIVTNFPLLYQKESVDFDGDFIILPITTATNITADNLATSWNLVYLAEDEVNGV